MTPLIRTLYLVPHSHTDIGYSHDPLAAIELHDRFLDRAISLCESTRDFPEEARFRWTVEVIFSAIHWWENRSDADRGRLRECLRRGEIEVGARYLNGTELYAPEDIAWEAGELERWAECCGTRPRTAIQNDVNGFPLPMARKLAAAGVDALVMGLNTTMGHSPFPRCTGFQWDLGEGTPWLVWNGWIYNRIKTYCHLDDLAGRFEDQAGAFFASLPPEYPYDFALTSATIGDNVGPFPSLPEQVRRFNEKSSSLQLCLATFSEVAGRLREASAEIPTHSGAWPDFWTFGAGSMPQATGMIRRAQRRLRIVEAFRELGWARESGGTLNMDRARAALAMACEHTYDSHSSSGEDSGTADSLRQKAQIAYEASVAETASMVLLRDHLAAMAAKQEKTPVSVLVANPHPFALHGPYCSEKKGLLAFASSRRPEHLFQFDREPTAEALARSGTFGLAAREWPALSMGCFPLEPHPKRESPAADSLPVDYDLDGPRVRITSRPGASFPLIEVFSSDNSPFFDADAEFPPLALVEERPLAGFQVKGLTELDPADTAWNPDLRFERRTLPLAAPPQQVSGIDGRRIAFEQQQGLVRRLELAGVPGHPEALMVTLSMHLDADPSVRGYYLSFPFQLPGTDDVDYWVDSCGTPYRAGVGQLPGSCTNFYQTYRGVGVHRSGQTTYLVSPDSTLFQLGGFTFGKSPHQPMERRRPVLLAWLYNNYWDTNFPSYSPGHCRFRFLLKSEPGDFCPEIIRKLDASFDLDYLTHPVA